MEHLLFAEFGSRVRSVRYKLPDWLAPFDQYKGLDADMLAMYQHGLGTGFEGLTGLKEHSDFLESLQALVG
jgi:hypothetical protein